jgi:PhnB protein
MRLSAYLSFNGECEAAFKFYEKSLGGKIVYMMTWGASPMAAQAPPDWGQKILHCTFSLGDQILAGADAPPGQYRKPQGICVTFETGDPAEADRVFAALSEKAEVQVPIHETFWASRFAVLIDQFGTPWIINCGKQPA